VQGKVLVAGQFALIGALIFLPFVVTGEPTGIVELVGWALVVGGVALGLVAGTGLGAALTPWPEPNAAGRLRTDGLYGVVRHPIYAAVLLVGFGLALRALSVWTVATALALLILLNVKARYEERLLAARYPEYTDYASRVPRFLPRPGPSRS
jgi:protein-S-isoprenylcysteine O-methyltransferase Ste14